MKAAAEGLERAARAVGSATKFFLEPKDAIDVRDRQFDNILGEDDNVYCFNPSVAHWHDNYYLCTYRRFTRGISSRIKEANHPFLSEPWWKTGELGFDNTALCILRINSHSQFEMEKKLGVFEETVDARLIKFSDDGFILSYNTPDRQNWIAGGGDPIDCSKPDGCH